MFTWPSFLPNPDVDLSGELNTASIRTNMDSGRARVRRRFTSDMESYSVAWTLDNDQFALFKSIFYNELKSGTDWFTINLPVDDSLTPVTARFSSQGFNKRHTSVMYWKVTATLELLDPVYTLSADDLAALLFLENNLAGYELAVEHFNTSVNYNLFQLLN